MTLLDFVILILATGQVLDVWFNGSIFAGWRKATEDVELLQCPFCLNVHVPIVLLIISWLTAPAGWWVVSALAVSRAAWLINAALPEELQYRAPVITLFEKVDEPGNSAESDDTAASTPEDGTTGRTVSPMGSIHPAVIRHDP